MTTTNANPETPYTGWARAAARLASPAPLAPTPCDWCKALVARARMTIVGGGSECDSLVCEACASEGEPNTSTVYCHACADYRPRAGAVERTSLPGAIIVAPFWTCAECEVAAAPGVAEGPMDEVPAGALDAGNVHVFTGGAPQAVTGGGVVIGVGTPRAVGAVGSATLPVAALIDTIAGLVAQVPGGNVASVTLHGPAALAALGVLPDAQTREWPSPELGTVFAVCVERHGVEITALHSEPIALAAVAADGTVAL